MRIVINASFAYWYVGLFCGDDFGDRLYNMWGVQNVMSGICVLMCRALLRRLFRKYTL